MPRLLTKSVPIFVNIHGDMPVEQKDVSTQADMFLAVSSPKQPEHVEPSISFCDEETMYVCTYAMLYSTMSSV